MSVTTVTTHWEGSTGQGKGNNPALGTVTYQTKWIVQTNDALDQVNTVLNYFRNDSTLPYYGRSFRYGNDVNPDVICIGLGAEKRESNRFIWDVTAEYETQAGSGFPAGTGSSALPEDFEPIEMDVSETSVTIPVYIARYHSGGKGAFHANRTKMNNDEADFLRGRPAFGGGLLKGGPVVNSANVIYDPPLEMEVDIEIVRITASYAEFEGNLWWQWRGHVNEAAGALTHRRLKYSNYWAKQTARVHSIGGRPTVSNKNRLYWRITFEFWINPLTWRDFIPDRGLLRAAGSGDVNGRGATYSSTDILNGMARTEPIKGPDQLTDITEPVLLDGNGQPLDKGYPPVYLEYQKYGERDFNPLLLDIGRR